MNRFLYFFIVFLRIITAPLVFIWPLPAIILSFFLDSIDIEFASQKVLTLAEYERWDKALDLWWYLNAMIFGWFSFPYFKYFLLFLFVFRLIGDLIFFLKGDRRILFLFPNFFENVFLLISLSLFIKPLNFLLDGKYFLTSLTVVILLKIFQEWWIHVALISIPEKFFGIKRNWRK